VSQWKINIIMIAVTS